MVAIGKASHTMVQAFSDRFGPGIGITGIACGPVLPDAQVFGFRYYKGGHPIPNQDSVKAAEAMLRAVEPLTSRDLVIFMLSGGGSALVEKPIADSISLEDLVATYRALVHSGRADCANQHRPQAPVRHQGRPAGAGGVSGPPAFHHDQRRS